MKEYHKIETIFERDMEGSRQLIYGQWRNKTIEFLQHADWVFTEKIDGTNICIEWDGHKVQFYGRKENSQIPTHLFERLNELFNGEINEELFEQAFGETPTILYGEGYGPKIQNGDRYRDDVDFILFDVYKPCSDIWLDREAVEAIAKIFNIDVVPILFHGDLQSGMDFVKTHPKSTIGEADMEGVVARPGIELKDQSGRRVIVKIKVKDFEK